MKLISNLKDLEQIKSESDRAVVKDYFLKIFGEDSNEEYLVYFEEGDNILGTIEKAYLSEDQKGLLFRSYFEDTDTWESVEIVNNLIVITMIFTDSFGMVYFISNEKWLPKEFKQQVINHPTLRYINENYA
jgi:hypothetical protein